jgi:hypothetical protein
MVRFVTGIRLRRGARTRAAMRDPDAVGCRKRTASFSTFVSPTSSEQLIPIVWTKCPRGGRRPWFLCEPPGRYCGRRVALLYSGGELFACRRCYGLAYESQQQSEFLRGLRKAQKIRVRLGGSPNLLHPLPEKPKGMHWRSYRRIKRVYETAKRSSK